MIESTEQAGGAGVNGVGNVGDGASVEDTVGDCVEAKVGENVGNPVTIGDAVGDTDW